jgi:hypothetical protein
MWRGSNHPDTSAMIRKIKETSKICCNLPLLIGKVLKNEAFLRQRLDRPKITRSLEAHAWYSLLRIMSPTRNEEKKNYNARRANVIGVFYKTSNEDSCASVLADSHHPSYWIARFLLPTMILWTTTMIMMLLWMMMTIKTV